MHIMHYAQWVPFPRDLYDLTWRFKSWGMDVLHKGIPLVLDNKLIDYMSEWNYGFDFDNIHLYVHLFSVILLGTKISICGEPLVVLDEIIIHTSQGNKCVYQREDGVIISPIKAHYAYLQDE